MKITTSFHPIRVQIDLPSSKSISNRLLMIKALSGLDFQIINLSQASDTLILEGALQIIGSSPNSNEAVSIDISDAGTPMRFLAAFLSIKPGKWLLTGNPRMCKRPIGPLVDALRSLGAQIDYTKDEGYPPLLIKGCNLNGEEVSIQAGISSQFISALMLIAPVFTKGLTIRMTGKQVSAPYVVMTAKLMEMAGIKVHQQEEIMQIDHQQYCPDCFKVEADWSAAAFWYEIAAFSEGSNIELQGLSNSGLQGDSQVADIFTQLGVNSIFADEGVIISRSPKPAVEHFVFDFTSCPDLVLPVAVACAGLNIDATLSGLKALRIKESDRFKALLTELIALGYKADELPGDVLRISPKEILNLPKKSSVIKTYNDHRMAMAFAPLTILHKELEISDPQVVNKSYPDFWNHMTKAGFVLEF
jgi:3-phosphoshikimate 1-carboxyvinyltransferase